MVSGGLVLATLQRVDGECWLVLATLQCYDGEWWVSGGYPSML